MLAVDHDGADRAQLRLDFVEVGEELVTDEEDRRFGVVDYLGHLRRRQPPVDVDEDCVELGRTEQHLEVFRRVLVDTGNPALRRHTGGPQRLSDGVGAAIEFAPGDLLAGIEHGDPV